MYEELKGGILIVDDVASNIQMLANALRDDYRIRATTEGLKAVEIAASDDPPDLILLDIVMPGIDGYEVCRRLKGDARTMSIPIIFVTGMSTVEDEAQGLNLGAVDYITKPFNVPIVRARVRTHVNLKQKTDMLEKLSSLDGLTGIPNRRNFDHALELEWRRAQREKGVISVIMADIDYFKAFNDNYGHGAGDECLKAVARALSGVVKRPGDMIARYGGEEFIVLLPGTDGDGAAFIGERLRLAVEWLKYPHAFSQVARYVTISAGYASTVPTDEHKQEELLERADSALYNAKRQGRNVVSAWKKEKGGK